MVAVLVLAFGMLGLVGLQLSTLRNNESALDRGMAVVQTHSIADAMRADRSNAGDKKFDIGIDANAPGGATFPELAVRTWRQNLISALGEGTTGSIACNKTGNAIRCSIGVRWDDTRGSGSKSGDDKHIVTTDVQL